MGNSITKTAFYLRDFLQVNLEQDTLCRIGPVKSSEAENGDVSLTAELIKQKHLKNKNFFNDDESLSDVYIRMRLYNNDVVRLMLSAAKQDFVDQSPMLQWDASMQRAECQLIEEQDCWAVTDGKTIRFKVGKNDFAPEIFTDEKTDIEFQEEDYFFTEYYDALSAMLLIRKNKSVTMGISLKIDGNEHFCGTGERFARINLCGQQIDLVNENGHGVNSPRTYKNIPFLLSSKPYGIFVHSNAKMRLDIGHHSSRSLQWLCEDDVMDIFFIGGASFEKILLNYRKITGFPAMPPVWSFGGWMSKSSYLNADELEKVATRLRDEEYPIDVLHIDRWHGDQWKLDFKFSKDHFPEPQQLIKNLRDRGFRLSLWIYPYINPGVGLLKTAREKGYVGKVTNPADAVEFGDTIDFSNPEAVEWFKGMLRPLLKMGTAVFKTDFAENIDETAVYKSIDGQKYRNLFALLYQKATWEVMEEFIDEPLLWARSSWAGCQRYPVHWAGDPSSTFDGALNCLWGGLHLGLSGFAFWSHDVGGFYGIKQFDEKPSDELYVRWTQFGVLSSHIRFHGMSPREPWEYPAVSDIVRQWLRFRYALIPYLIAQSEKCCRSGLPVLRPLVIEWTDDPAVWSISDQYMLGDAFLVCPVFNAEGIRDIYLPKGKWVDFWNGEVSTGPACLKKIKSRLSRIPIYVRYGSQVEFAEPVQCTDQLKDAKRFSIRFDDSYSGIDKSRLVKMIKL